MLLDVVEKKKLFNIHMFHFTYVVFYSMLVMCMVDTFHLNQNQTFIRLNELNTCWMIKKINSIHESSLWVNKLYLLKKNYC